MKVRKLSPTGDYTFGAGFLNFYINEPLTVGQIVDTTLQLFKGEWFLDNTVGVPYFSGVLAQSSQVVADVTIQNQIIAVQGVVNIENYESTLEDRNYIATAILNTIFGQAETGFATSNVPPPTPVLNKGLITQSGFYITTQSGENIDS